MLAGSADGRIEMSRTLFWYVFKNLFRVFMAAVGIIAAIMTFGGLLKPLTEGGLQLAQVGQILAFATPAMWTYALPIGALFATSIVYGRLAADNEVTAIRAAGISLGPLGLGMPALVMGLICAVFSVISLSVIVPAASLRVERTIVSNIGQFVVNRIEQQHQVRLQQPGGQAPLTVYARSATLGKPDPESPNEQVVIMTDVSIVTYEDEGKDKDKKLQVPDEFYIASEARAYIRQPDYENSDEDPVLFRASLTRGMKFPRTTIGRSENAIAGGVGGLQFGPFELRSPLRENTKFMDIRRLKQLLEQPEKSRRMSEMLRGFIRADQQREYLLSLQKELTYGLGVVKFKALNGDEFTLQPGTLAPVIERNRLVLGTASGGARESVRLIHRRKNAAWIESIAREAHLRVFPDTDEKRLAVAVELHDTIVRGPDYENPLLSFERNFNIAMPTPVLAIASRSARHYLADTTNILPDQKRSLQRAQMKQENSVISEMHSRASFGISCLVLTMVGYGLGVMFKSGNYLTAFAVSVVPALMSIVLIVTGQHICENVPQDIGPNFQNPLQLGLIVIWAGNAFVLGLAVVLLVRLRRT